MYSRKRLRQSASGNSEENANSNSSSSGSNVDRGTLDEARIPLSSTYTTPSLRINPEPPSGSGYNVGSRKRRGRPRQNSDGMDPPPRPSSVGQRNLQPSVSGPGFTLHTVIVNPGEDVALKIMQFFNNGPRTVFILCAAGSISRVNLLRPLRPLCVPVSREDVGPFHLFFLSGVFYVSEDGNHMISVGLNTLLVSEDGHILVGKLGRIMTAATQVQVVLGSFVSDEEQTPHSTIPQPVLSMLSPPNRLRVDVPVELDNIFAHRGSSESFHQHGISPINLTDGSNLLNLMGGSNLFELMARSNPLNPMARIDQNSYANPSARLALVYRTVSEHTTTSEHTTSSKKWQGPSEGRDRGAP